MNLEINRTEMSKEDKETIIESLNMVIDGGTIEEYCDQLKDDTKSLERSAKRDMIFAGVAFGVSIIAFLVFIYFVMTK